MGSPLDQDFLDAFAPRWWAAWNGRDAEAIASMVTDDLVYYNPALDEDLHGREAMFDYAAMIGQAFPDGRFTTPEPPYASLTQPKGIVPWHFVGTHAGDFVPMGFKATGGVLDVDGVDHWWFRDGRICRHRAMFDFAQAMRSIGATTPV
jgi:steroid delta-isomerase-like uncharacterized protein